MTEEPLGLDRADHLVLHLRHVARIEEVRGDEALVVDLLGMRIERPGPGQLEGLGIAWSSGHGASSVRVYR